MAAFHNAGYKWVESYIHPKSFKTDAPYTFIYDIVRHWKKKCAEEEDGGDVYKYIKKDSIGDKIMQTELTHAIDMENVPNNIRSFCSRKKGRYLPNPEKNWGPKPAANIKAKMNPKVDEVAKKLLKTS